MTGRGWGCGRSDVRKNKRPPLVRLGAGDDFQRGDTVCDRLLLGQLGKETVLFVHYVHVIVLPRQTGTNVGENS
jgi:hypothetical protein